MCGILFVKSQQPLDLAVHLQALTKIQSRGPDHTVYAHHDTVFVAHTVLHITGEDQFYREPHTDFVAYNGEIYNYRWFGNYSTDTELIYRTVRDRNMRKFPYFEGPWAWVYTDFESVHYATDPQGERCLYRYQDQNILIVSSEVSAILCYVNAKIAINPHSEKHWPTVSTTPYQGISRCEPGRLYDFSGAVGTIDSIFDWSREPQQVSDQDAQQEFDHIWDTVIAQMQPQRPVGITVSGGVDSGLILAAMPQADAFYTVDCVGKDTVSTRAAEFLTPVQRQRHCVLTMTAESWAHSMIECMQHSAMPVQSWSFVGQWNIAKHCKQPVLFTGVGADELFGGYPVYQTLHFDANTSVSPYSVHDPDSDSAQLWQRCLDSSHGHAGRATLLMDYSIQVSAVDARGVDSMTQAHGVEPRSPFMHPKIIKFALNLPWRLRLGKPLLRSRFLRHWSSDLLLPKQGFAGHCNDSLPWLDIAISADTNRAQQWQQIQQASFQRYCGTGSSQ